MCPLLETICLKEGSLLNLTFHQQRMKVARAELFPSAPTIDLNQVLELPDDCKTGVYKVRIIYGQFIEKIEFLPYHLRKVTSLKIVKHESIDYHLKFTDRQLLQQLFDQRGNCDDILIVRNGYVTDSFAANVLFFDGSKWLTPSTPLLKGTQRALLLKLGKIVEKEIRIEDVPLFQKVGLINAMNSFELMPQIPITHVHGL